jgi:hypothetical protein
MAAADDDDVEVCWEDHDFIAYYLQGRIAATYTKEGE